MSNTAEGRAGSEEPSQSLATPTEGGKVGTGTQPGLFQGFLFGKAEPAARTLAFSFSLS